MPLALAIVLPTLSCQGQDIEPRRWSHLPIGGNFGALAYAYTEGDIFIDPVLRLEDAKFNLHTLAGRYIRSFELLGKSARVELIQAYQSGEWNGLLDGVPARVERDGWTDTSLRFAANLIGAPPLSGKEFAAYRAGTESETTLGVGLLLQLPTGQYLEDKLINLGSNRFTFRPQVGVVHDWGKWSAELTGAASFFTDNDEFFNGRHLEQAALFTVDGSLIYTFLPGLWLSASIGYAGGGESTVNSIDLDNRQSNVGWALGLGIPINRYLGVKITYISIRTRARTGMDTDTISCAISASW